MEWRYLITKSLRRVSLFCGLPEINQKRILKKTGNTFELPPFDLSLAKQDLAPFFRGEGGQRIQDQVGVIRQGKTSVFCEPRLNREPCFFLRHPRTGRSESLVPWTKLRITNQGCDEDVKFLWEVNRLADLDSLVALSIWEDDPAYLRNARDIVLQWDKENPWNQGVNWFSNMEVALRLLRLLCLQGFLSWFGLKNEAITRLIVQHAVHVKADWKATRRTMKGGNHLLVELAALTAFDALTEKAGDECFELKKEMERQFLTDGGYFEGSLGYHLYVCNVLLFVHWLCRIANVKSPVQKDLLHNALFFLQKLTGPDGTLPRIGDWDEGFVFCPCKEFPLKVDKMLNFGQLILGSHYDINKNKKVVLFPDSQMASFRYDNGDLIIFRSANVEHGHSHLDMLSIHYIGANGPVIMDAGTFQYNQSKEKRNEYRGINAHSTIVADEKFQPLKPFRTFAWSGKLAADIVVDDRSIHGEYQLKNSIKLQRTIYFLNDGFLVQDKCHGPYDFFSQFIVPRAEIDGKKVLVFDPKGVLKLSIISQSDVDPMIKKKSVSDCYGQEKEADTILYHINNDINNTLKIYCLN